MRRATTPKYTNQNDAAQYLFMPFAPSRTVIDDIEPETDPNEVEEAAPRTSHGDEDDEEHEGRHSMHDGPARGGTAHEKQRKAGMVNAVLAAAKEAEVSPDAFALGAVLAQTDFDPMVLSGAVTSQQLQSNLEALAVAKTLQSSAGSALLDETLARVRMDPLAYWTERGALAWN